MTFLSVQPIGGIVATAPDHGNEIAGVPIQVDLTVKKMAKYRLHLNAKVYPLLQQYESANSPASHVRLTEPGEPVLRESA